MKTFICCVLAFAALANADPEAQNRFVPQQPAPAVNAVPVGAPVAFQGPPRPHQFGYEVVDAEAGNAYGHRESTDEAGVTKGEFRIVLPDTRTQITRYTVSKETGYVAEVSYEGTPVYPPAPAPKETQ